MNNPLKMLSDLESDFPFNEFKDRIKEAFNYACLDYLMDSCVLENCENSHILPDEKDFKIHLERVNDRELDVIYVFIWCNFKVVSKYLPTLCEIYTLRNNDEIFFKMIDDCERYSECHVFYKDIVNSLVELGHSRTSIMLRITEYPSANKNQVKDTIIDMMIEFNPLNYIDTFKSYSRNKKYQFKDNAIIRLMKACIKTENYELMKVTTDIIVKQSREVYLAKKFRGMKFFLKLCDKMEEEQTI